MNVRQLLNARLCVQRLASHDFNTPKALVAYMIAVQAQDYAAAKWALGLRLPNASDTAIDKVFNDGAILRTHVMRPTWHFVAPADIRWLLRLTAPRVNAFNAYMYRKMELDETIFRKSDKLMAKALRGNNYTTRTDLEAILTQAGIATNEERMTCIMMHAELDGLICSGPRIGKQFSYALLEERVSAAKELTRDESLARLALGYFTSRGPATLQDFVWWSGLTAADCKAGLSMIRPKLVCEKVNGMELWFADNGIPKKVNSAFLIPNFDEYAVAYKDRDALYDKTKLERTLTPFELLGNLIIVDGQVCGLWKRTLKKDSVALSLKYLYPVSASTRKKVAMAAERYKDFLGVATVTID